MGKQDLEPHKVTKPIQLLAAWLVGLVSIDSAFLGAARLIHNPEWAPGLLVIAAIVNVPLFLICIFLLQTKFRPEMQEDTFYSKYLEKRQSIQTNEVVTGEMNIVRRQLLESNSKVLEFIEQFQSQIHGLEGAVGSLTERVDGRDSTQIDTQLEQAKAYLETALKNAEWGLVRVSVNDLLEFFPEIETRLNTAGIDITDTFGSSSHVGGKPSKSIISFGEDVPIENAQEILRLLSDLDFEGVDIMNESPLNDSILIGSYGYRFRPFTVLNEELIKALLDSSLTTKQFQRLIKRSKHSSSRETVND
jgi:hypothetical protein